MPSGVRLVAIPARLIENAVRGRIVIRGDRVGRLLRDVQALQDIATSEGRALAATVDDDQAYDPEYMRAEMTFDEVVTHDVEQALRHLQDRNFAEDGALDPLSRDELREAARRLGLGSPPASRSYYEEDIDRWTYFVRHEIENIAKSRFIDAYDAAMHRLGKGMRGNSVRGRILGPGARPTAPSSPSSGVLLRRRTGDYELVVLLVSPTVKRLIVEDTRPWGGAWARDFVRGQRKMADYLDWDAELCDFDVLDWYVREMTEDFIVREHFRDIFGEQPPI